ncbi:hypothetical protein I307_05995 [Cryptococcus deuterogattii 99/473]|uniref:Uncharacterized protein n=1 Tax=Cryptococcus deuterogattii Ram5 TaxID=1296110 RepID=A0A0D0V4W7_9TREE|nr:hypothetical protein I309_01920 [Cryptococcus deuterogattii LA55]KIR33991.1 hypothetical protein I352_03221 [Cryptococcus deuterogattii MMRL2647]KIR41624.1 hypothetical protein I313_02758 [Cryptococcus deuterogattii Ram5]KIR71866.1 hypothetical protein I310_04549 [Cryptococcus deuterogattii CA1014]KIR91448.1 hypothetical protein I304_04922 [Cryptococcus deuterogattii CBS 10090]KIR98363.1 hypothetical protein L804_03932 [Cryptococcus deuterogattii 2001/935-1]KIY54714.1 hypothetical protein 
MSRSTISSLESQLSTATHELELATFLNKGILQTNTEYKLRIAELESENIILRKAESRLAGTEDALEDAEKRIKVLEEERDVWEEELETAKENMESAKRDKDAAIRERDHERNQRELWEERFWELRGSLEGLVERANYQTAPLTAYCDVFTSATADTRSCKEEKMAGGIGERGGRCLCTQGWEAESHG